jgi:hypothetical protein
MQTPVSSKHILREPGSPREWHFTEVDGGMVRVQVVCAGAMGRCQRWVLVKSFARDHDTVVPWNPFTKGYSHGYSFLDFRVNYFSDYETHYCTVEFAASQDYAVVMEAADARLLWAHISRNWVEVARFEREVDAIKKIAKAQTHKT